MLENELIKFPEDSELPKFLSELQKREKFILSKIREIEGDNPIDQLVNRLCLGITNYLAFPFVNDQRFKLTIIFCFTQLSPDHSGHCVLGIEEKKSGLAITLDGTPQQIPAFINHLEGELLILGPFTNDYELGLALQNTYRKPNGEYSYYWFSKPLTNLTNDNLEHVLNYIKSGRPTTPYAPLE